MSDDQHTDSISPEPASPEPARLFADALKADIVIESLDHSGPLNTSEALASRDWFERERQSSGGS